MEPGQGSLNIIGIENCAKNTSNKLDELAGIRQQFWVSCQSPGWAHDRVLAGPVE